MEIKVNRSTKLFLNYIAMYRKISIILCMYIHNISFASIISIIYFNLFYAKHHSDIKRHLQPLGHLQPLAQRLELPGYSTNFSSH